MRLSLILRSATATWVAVLVAAVARLSPFILHRLGDEACCFWVLVVALTNYYMSLRVGFPRGAVGSLVLLRIERACWVSGHSSFFEGDWG